jgi:hypothetical protein
MLFSLINISGGFSENPPPSGEKLPFGLLRDFRLSVCPPLPHRTLSVSLFLPSSRREPASFIYRIIVLARIHLLVCVPLPWKCLPRSELAGKACRDQRPARQCSLSLSLFRILHAESRLFSSVKPANERI